MGAVSALLYGESQCGISKHPVANSRKSIYEGLIALLEADDGSWTAKDTIYDWEDSGCEQVKRQAFPNDQDYAVLPQFALPHFNYNFAKAGCWIVDDETDYIIWQKDAFKKCTIAAMVEESSMP